MRKLRTLGIALVCVHGLLWSQVSPAYQVDILHTGYVLPDGGRQLVPGVDEENGGRFVGSTIALVRGGDTNNPTILVVDPGFGANRASLRAALEAIDPTLRLRDVTDVFLSHHHPDHVVNTGVFPNAVVVDYWATYGANNGPDGYSWEDHGDNYEMAPDIIVLRTPGHTNEGATLLVNTGNGIVAFTHLWWFEDDGTFTEVPGTLFPPEDPLAEDRVLREGDDKITVIKGQRMLEDSRELVLFGNEDLVLFGNLPFLGADCIVPGHGHPLPNPNKDGLGCAMVH